MGHSSAIGCVDWIYVATLEEMSESLKNGRQRAYHTACIYCKLDIQQTFIAKIKTAVIDNTNIH